MVDVSRTPMLLSVLSNIQCIPRNNP